MKHIPGKVKDKYEILGIIGEGRVFLFEVLVSLFYIVKGAYGVVLKARKKVCSSPK
jgi:hypothetical protein